jgi:hypothetical protein
MQMEVFNATQRRSLWLSGAFELLHGVTCT